MSIDELGFFSPDIQTWIKKHRAENQAWFGLAEDLNRIGHRQLALLNVQADDNQAFLSALLFMRGLSNFQGAILMAERGMTQEGCTLVRGSFETVFCLGAIRKDPAFAEVFVRDDASRRQKLARSLLKDDGLELEPDHVEKLTRYLDDLAQSGVEANALRIERAAQIAGLASTYDTYYRSLSNDAAHPSVIALNRHVDTDENRVMTGLRWGPDVSDVEYTVATACTATIRLVLLAMEMIGQDEQSIGLDRCCQEYKRLTDLRIAEANGLSSPDEAKNY